jgi:pimeloyl-ACP methyl ester carboxylesterase
MMFVPARDGTRLAVAETPPAPDQPMRPAVLCLGGITRNSRDFDRLAPRLAARGHRVLALNLRGRGESGRAADPASYDPAIYIDDIRQVLAATGVHKTVVIGTSLGGFLAMGMAVAMPTVLAGAIINDSGPDVPTDGLDQILGYIETDPVYPDWAAAVAGVKTMLPDLNLDEEEWRLCAEGCFRERADGQVAADWDPRIAIPLRKSGGDVPDLWPLFAALRPFPTLALRGALSTLLSDACFSRMAEVHPGLRQAVIPNRGHAPTLNEPESRAAIDAFFDRLP